ncbi:MAG: ACT domain-containing protein [Desulfuromonadales bacterium]|nr:ACT domain-containing protein [Desulfuromonadales bacterium]
MSGLQLTLLEGLFAVHRLGPDSDIPPQLLREGFFAVTRSAEELSIVCSENFELASERVEREWCCLKVEGPLEFSLTGIIAGISTVLARAGISLFVVSTFDTDYLLVRSQALSAATEALLNAGYLIR